MIRSLRLFSALSVVLLVAAVAFSSPSSYRIDLQTRSLLPPEDIARFFADRTPGEPSAALVQLYQHVQRDERVRFSRAGVHLQTYVGGGAWAAYIEPDVTSSDLATLKVRWIGELAARDRMHPYIAEGQAPAWATMDGGRVIFSVRFMRPLPATEAEAILIDMGMEPGEYVELTHTWYVATTPDRAGELASRSEVLFVQWPSPPMDTVNGDAREITRAGEVNEPPYNLTGESVTVCVYDGGMVDTNHPDFAGRIDWGTGENGSVSDHPTHVAGSVGGAGPETYRGMAPGVGLVTYEYESCSPYCLYNSPQDIADNYLTALTDFGAQIATNSIGANIYVNYAPDFCHWQGDYEETSSLLDTLVNGGLGDNFIVLFAAGNERGSGGPCGSTYETMSVPAGAKNIISVGATDDNDFASSFTSYGPTDDGRVKPDVVAPGVQILSTLPGGGYGSMSGTSMATPITAGNTALLVDAFHTYIAPSTPAASTIKAILLNSAEDIGNDGPDYIYGFGRVDAVRGVESIMEYRFVEGEVADNGTWNQTFNVAAGEDELKLTIAWTDEPASGINPTVTLINDLDITLTSPGGTDYLPFILDPDNPSDDAVPGVNTIDNVEQVLVEDPEEGEWTVTVTGTDVPSGPQGFSIASTVPMTAGVMIVQGVVTDAVAGNPLENVTVGMMGGNVRVNTDEDGEYQLYLLSEGSEEVLLFEQFGYATQRLYIPIQAGETIIRDISMHTARTGTVDGLVTLEDGTPVSNLTVHVDNHPEITISTGADGRYHAILPAPGLYRLYLSAGNLFGEGTVHVEEGESDSLDIVVGNRVNRATVDDTWGYIGVESTDTHGWAPADFVWHAIDPDEEGGPGTRIEIEEEEDPNLVALPFDFSYYGQVFDELTVNENGFFIFGDGTGEDPDDIATYSNSQIPSPAGPANLVAPFWEDFKYNLTNLSYYHNTDSSIFILSWYDSRQWPDNSTFESFQVVLYDPEVYPTPTGDGLIRFNYLEVNDPGNATVGIESPDEESGVQMSYFDHEGNGGVAPTASLIDDETSMYLIRYVGSMEGTISLEPAGDPTTIRLRSGPVITWADENGDFYHHGLFPGTSTVSIGAEGYETVQWPMTVDGFEQVEDFELTLYQMVPPSNLDGYLLNQDTYRLTWEEPYGGGTLDEPVGRYRVYRDGSFLAETEGSHYDDSTVDPENENWYWVTALYHGGESDTSNHHQYTTDVSGATHALPQEFAVSKAWPNPFNPTTQVRVALPEAAELKVMVYDILGRETARLAAGRRDAGYHTLHWDGSAHASGMYFLQVEAGRHRAVRKVVLMK
ncbi:S8 family serine peptidase [bacterium]|nr:S8 family serine peptidase [bacterium]